MNRRSWLLIASSILGTVVLVTAPAGRWLQRLERVPRDLLARVRRRTRPLPPEPLDAPHDLAG